ncbi:hypothetical protein BHE90_008277 [Fusarium euwallaceae]|uniref:Uncharacterized protein n=1 Tax=Fusarium euwallaceae TaxID=1147111 RepID=A0A430LNE6_9HYPO|nr:hypothetical protein BHE90_008277 [Fusarium euwallaceae]
MATPALRTEKPPPPPPGTTTHFPLQLSPSQRIRHPKAGTPPPARGVIDPDPAHAAFTNGHRVTIRASRP